jgi:hypothetical protein
MILDTSKALKLGLIFTVALPGLPLPKAQAQPQLYASGKFPSGPVYTESDLQAFTGHQLPDPSYLTGRFIYLGLVKGEHAFSTFTVQSGKIVFGTTLINVQFFNNFPPGLTVGRVIRVTAEEPLRIRAVSRFESLLVVQAECWSQVQPQ